MALFRHASILRNTDNDTDNDPGQGNSNDPGFTEAQLKYLGGMLNQTVTSHLKRQPPLAEQLKGFNWAEIVAPIVQNLVPKPDDSDSGKGKKPEISEYEKQLANINKELEAYKRTAAEAQEKARASENARRVDAAKARLRSALTGQVQEHALDHAVNHLTLVSNRMVVDEDGAVKLKVKKPVYPGFPPEEQELPLEDAIKDVLSESDMKIFLPPPRGSGSNPGPGGGGKLPSSASFVGEAKTDAEKVQRAMVREAELKAKFNL